MEAVEQLSDELQPGQCARIGALDDADVSTRVSDQLGHAKVSRTQDRYLGRRLTDRITVDALEDLFGTGESQ